MAKYSLAAQQDFLERSSSMRDPVRALSEFIWNAVDADASKVEVRFKQNDLGGLQAIEIVDDGEGISSSTAEQAFSKLGDSLKKQSRRTHSGRVVHGQEGRGRLRFFSLAGRARWFTTSEEKGGFSSRSIEIHSNRLHDVEVIENDLPEVVSTGCSVILTHLKDTFDSLVSTDAYLQICAIFSPYVLQYPHVEIFYNNIKIDPSVTIRHWKDLDPLILEFDGKVIPKINIKVIEWNTLRDARQIYLGGDDGVVLGAQPANVRAPDVCFSAYAYSSFFQEMADANLLEMEGLNDPLFALVMSAVRDVLTDYFRTRKSEQSNNVIQELKDQGAYPYEGDPNNEVERRERQVFDIATHAINSHSKEFYRADSSLKRITLTLLKEAIKHNPDDISTIIQAVVNLGKAKQSELSSLLKKTQLSNIISSSTLISDRITTLSVLKEVVFEPKYRSSVKERGELDVLVQENTWLFGEEFHLTMAESGLTKVMNRIALDQGAKANNRKVTKGNGGVGRVDCFFGRSVPHPDGNKKEYILLELKRPSLKLGRKELDQVEDYVNSIQSQPEYIDTDTKWSFYLVATEILPEIKGRVYQSDRPHGLFLKGDNFNFWIKTWSEIVRENESRLKFVQDKLNVEVSDDEIERKIAEIQKLVSK